MTDYFGQSNKGIRALIDKARIAGFLMAQDPLGVAEYTVMEYDRYAEQLAAGLKVAKTQEEFKSIIDANGMSWAIGVWEIFKEVELGKK